MPSGLLVPFSGDRTGIVKSCAQTWLRQFAHRKYKINQKAVKVMKGL